MPFICVFNIFHQCFIVFSVKIFSPPCLNLFLRVFFVLFFNHRKRNWFLVSFLHNLFLGYRNAPGFCMLILYPATSLNLFILTGFWCSLQGFLYVRLCHPQTEMILFLSFRFGCLLLLFLAQLLCLGLLVLC